MKPKKAQAAFEYMIIIILVLVFLIPVWTYAANTQGNAGSHLSATYAKNAANRLAEAASFVDSQGPPSKIVVSIYVPGSVQSTSIADNTITFVVGSADSLSDVFAISSADVNGTLPAAEGNYRVAVEATASGVQINVV